MRTLHLGDVGTDVATWQTVLGLAVIDGKFGPKTLAATKAWQQKHDLIADGVVGLETWTAAGVKDEELPPLLRGLDVSAVQGVLSEATWTRLAEAGIRFAIMRAVVGNETWTDGSAKTNGERARALGIVAGAYVFAYPLPHLDPKREAERYVQKLEAMKVPLELPPAIDLEWPPREEAKKQADGTTTIVNTWEKWKCSPSQLRDWIAKCLARCGELTGSKWIVYTYRYWLKCIEAEKLPELGEHPLWLADYKHAGKWPTSAEVAKLAPPAPWKEIAIVQHDGNGGLRLPNGMDADFNCMLGGEDKLAELMGASKRYEPETEPTNATLAHYRLHRLEG